VSLRISVTNLSGIAFAITALSGIAMAQTDPGVRGGAPGAGSPIPGLTVKEGKFFSSGQDQFKQIQSVTGSVAGTEPGLGPRFNLNSCAGCHAFPAVGGSSPQLRNPQVDVGPPAQVSTLTGLGLISATGVQCRARV